MNGKQAPPEAASAPGVPDDPVLDAMWTKVFENWEDEKGHGALLDYALRNEKLPMLAGRYRALVNDEAKGPYSKKRLDAIVIAATQVMMAQKTPRPTKNPLWLNATAALIMIMVLLTVAYLLLKH